MEEVAEIPAVALVLPVLLDREERWRRFAKDLLGSRPGICGVKAYLARICRREVILAYVEVEGPEEAPRLLAASEESFEKWLKERLLEFHGYDLGRWRIGSSPELGLEQPGSSKLP